MPKTNQKLTEQTFDWKAVTVGEAEERIEAIDGELMRYVQQMREMLNTVFLLRMERKTHAWIIHEKTRRDGENDTL